MSATVELFALAALQGIKIYTEYLESSQTMTEEEVKEKWEETKIKVKTSMENFESAMLSNLNENGEGGN